MTMYQYRTHIVEEYADEADIEELTEEKKGLVAQRKLIDKASRLRADIMRLRGLEHLAPMSPIVGEEERLRRNRDDWERHARALQARLDAYSLASDTGDRALSKSLPKGDWSHAHTVALVFGLGLVFLGFAHLLH